MGERKSFSERMAEIDAQHAARKAEIKAQSEARKAERKAKAEERKAKYEQSKAEAKNALGEAPSIKEAWTASFAGPREQFKARMAEVDAQNAERLGKAQARAEAKKRSPIGGLFVASALTFGVLIDRVDATVRAGRQTLPIAGTTVEFSAGNAHRRVTATRMALTGPLAFALKKDAGHNFLVFTAADGRQCVTTVEPKRTSSAMQFAAEFNSLASLLAAADAVPAEE